MPVNEPVGAVVYSMDTSNVDSVYVGGPARKQAAQALAQATGGHVSGAIVLTP